MPKPAVLNYKTAGFGIYLVRARLFLRHRAGIENLRKFFAVVGDGIPVHVADAESAPRLGGMIFVAAV